MMPLSQYRRVWAVDFEFTAHPGYRPTPLCFVARELHTGELRRGWLDDGAATLPAYDIGPDSLFVAYYASAELGCHLALGWPMPARILDLCAEFRCITSGLAVPCGRSLLGAMAYHGLDALAVAEKDAMRQLGMRGGPFTVAEQLALLKYCQTDVDALARLLPRMLAKIDLPRALLRGRYMAAVAHMERNGVPIDVAALNRLQRHWTAIKGRLIAAVDADSRVFVPAGQQHLDPHSEFGAAVMSEAEARGIDPHQVAYAARLLCELECEKSAEDIRSAEVVIRLSVQRQVENPFIDHTYFSTLESAVSERGFVSSPVRIQADDLSAADADDADDVGQPCAGPLRDPTTRLRHDPAIIHKAADLVAKSGPEDYRPMKFSAERFAAYLASKGIAWPRLPSGALALDDATFKEMARIHPADVGPIRELRHALSQLRLNKLAVGTDGRNRVLISAFASKTGRNQPSNNKFIFGPSTWFRLLIRPEPGRALAYVDWCAQEYGIAAALSGDEGMKLDYRSGDPYLAFAKRARAVPAHANKRSHAKERESYKVCCGLGAMYGAGERSLATRLGISTAQARALLRLHHENYPQFWRWSDAQQDFAMFHGYLQTRFGWRVHVGTDANPRSLRNFPMQANGAEMLRLACCLATEQGIMVCAPVHDALLVEGPADEIDDVVRQTQDVMRKASELVLPGFPLRTDAKIVRYPDRYVDDRGRRMWDIVMELLDAVGR